MPTEQKPSVGRIVLVGCDPSRNNGAKVAPAVITRVWSDVCINARALPDSDNPPEQRFSITYVGSLEDLEATDDRLYRWTWPPRV